MLKFCCQKFEFHYSGKKQFGLNIRIIGLSEDFVQRGNLDFDMTYFITEGYENDIDNCKKRIVINFCPFCGTNLRKYYIDKDYIQETMNL